MSKPPKYNLRQLHLNAEILEERQMLSVVTVSASGDQDGEAFSVLVNGEVEQSFIATEQTQAFQLETGEQLQANDIQIEFVDDGDDSELKIEFVEIDGVRVEDLSTLQAERSSEDVSTSTVPAETQSDSTPASGNRAPEFTEPNDEVRNVSPGESVSYVVAASDEDGDALTWSATGLPEGLWIDSCTGEISGTIADDAAGSFASEITVSDGTDSTTKKVEWVVTSTSENNAPTFTNPNDESRNVSPGESVSSIVEASDLDGDTITWSATGLPGGLTIDSSTGEISGTVADDAAGSFASEITISDGTDSTTKKVEWVVTSTSENNAPTFTNPNDESRNVSPGESISSIVEASDLDGDTITWSATGLPDGLAIDSSTGEISGTIADDASESYTSIITISDGTDSTTKKIEWVVALTSENNAPTFKNPNDESRSAQPGESVSFVVEASDLDGDTITWSATGLPDGLAIDSSTGEISGTIADDASESYTTVITISDGVDSTNKAIQWTVSDSSVNRPPTFIETREVQIGESVSFALSASDLDGDSISWSASNLPSGLSIDATTGEISGVVSDEAASSYRSIITISDGEEAATMVIEWSVASVVVNTPPEFTDPNDVTRFVNAGDSISVVVSASDVDGDTITWDATELPDGLSIDPSTGTVSGTIAAEASGAYESVITITDGTDSTSKKVLWNVSNSEVNNPPTFVDPNNEIRTAEIGDSVSFVVAAFDSDGEAIIWSATDLPDGLSIDPSTGEISGVVAEEALESYASVITITDGTDSVSKTVQWTVVSKNTPPTFTENREVEIGESVSFLVPVSDLDGDTITWSATDLPAGLSIDPSTGEVSGVVAEEALESYTSRIEITDGTDTVSKSIEWVVSDRNTSPTFTKSIQAQVGDSISLAASATDLDGDTMTWSAIGLPDGLSIDVDTGEISGVISDDALESYLTVISITDGELSISRKIEWTILSTKV